MKCRRTASDGALFLLWMSFEPGVCGGWFSVSQSSRTGINVPARGVKSTVPPAADARVLLKPAPSDQTKFTQ